MLRKGQIADLQTDQPTSIKDWYGDNTLTDMLISPSYSLLPDCNEFDHVFSIHIVSYNFILLY